MLKLKIFGSSSKGNCYELSSNGNSLLLDCGYKNINHNFANVKGILLSHQHNDHIGAILNIKDLYKGKFYSHSDVLDILPILDTYKVKINENESFKIDNFSILPFEVNHDAKNYNYLIKDSISNMKVLYLTDISNMNDFQFNDIDVFLIETNYNEDTVDYEDFKIQRLIQTHSSLQETTDFLLNNINHNTKKIFLIHISRSQEDYQYFANYVKEKISNENIKVIAINPKMTESVEYNLHEEVNVEFD